MPLVYNANSRVWTDQLNCQVVLSPDCVQRARNFVCRAGSQKYLPPWISYQHHTFTGYCNCANIRVSLAEKPAGSVLCHWYVDSVNSKSEVHFRQSQLANGCLFQFKLQTIRRPYVRSHSLNNPLGLPGVPVRCLSWARSWPYAACSVNFFVSQHDISLEDPTQSLRVYSGTNTQSGKDVQVSKRIPLLQLVPECPRPS